MRHLLVPHKKTTTVAMVLIEEALPPITPIIQGQPITALDCSISVCQVLPTRHPLRILLWTKSHRLKLKSSLQRLKRKMMIRKKSNSNQALDNQLKWGFWMMMVKRLRDLLQIARILPLCLR